MYESEGPLRDDLQELVDRVSALLGAPATLEDADFTLLAFCAHPMAHTFNSDDGGAVLDAVRTRSILTRGSPPETRRRFEEFGIATAEAPLRTPDDPAAGILTRLMIPVRHAGTTLGYLWLLDGGRTDPTDLDDPALAEAVGLAEEAGRRLARPDRDGDLGDVLATALTGPPSARAGAERTLAAALGRTAVVVVALHPPGGLPAEWAVAAPGAIATSVLDGGAGAVLVPLPAGADLRPAAAMSSAALAGLPPGSTAGISAVRDGLTGLAAQWWQARVAAAVAAISPRLSPAASWDELGSWRLVSRLDAPDPAVGPLLADAVLAETAERWLDAGGSAGRAAEALCVHRQTLYYRLGRIEGLTGLDLSDGDARLLLHASLRRARLPAVL
jgi:hypothetical protein